MTAPGGTALGRTSYSAYAGYNSGLHANLIVQRWRAETFKVMMAQDPFLPFQSAGSDNVFQVKKDFLKEAGDKETFALRALLTGDGQGDDGTIVGNEEKMAFYDDSVTIHQRINGVVINGEMSEKRTILNLRQEARDAIGEWGARVQAADKVSALSSQYTLSFDGQVTGDVAVDASGSNIDTVNYVAPSTDRIWYGGQSTAGVLSEVATELLVESSNGQKFGTLVISRVKQLATRTIAWEDTNTAAVLQPIRPLKGNGYEFVMFIHPLQYADLRAETAWITAQTNAQIRGDKNPLFTGAVNSVAGIWDGVLIVVCQLINSRKGDASGVTATDPATWFNTGVHCATGIAVARALFCGAQAGLISWGKLPDWREDPQASYTRKFKVNTSMIYGVKKAQFNSLDFGVYAVDTAITLPT